MSALAHRLHPLIVRDRSATRRDACWPISATQIEAYPVPCENFASLGVSDAVRPRTSPRYG
jgi:hypothetical protein